MKRGKIINFVIVALLLAFSAFAAQINSTSYKQTVIVSNGGVNSSSSSYKETIVMGIINGIINSTSYINKLGFLHLLLLANGQPCTSANQCEGGFCCSNLCQSSACTSPSPSPSPSGGGGSQSAGGGGGTVNRTVGNIGGGGTEKKAKEEIKDFSISESTIKERVILDSAKTKTIKIKNNGNVALSINLNVLTVNDIVFLSDNSFSLEPNQEKSVEVNIIGKKLGSYFGEIGASADGIKKSANVVVDVVSEQVLFDVKMDIPSAYTEVEPGGELKSQITLINVGPANTVDVTPTYIIKDKNGNVIYEFTETFAVEKQKSYVQSMKIPGNSQPGDYLAVIELRYKNSFAVSSELFKVVSTEPAAKKIVLSNLSLISIIIVSLGLIFLFGYLITPKKKFFK